MDEIGTFGVFFGWTAALSQNLAEDEEPRPQPEKKQPAPPAIKEKPKEKPQPKEKPVKEKPQPKEEKKQAPAKTRKEKDEDAPKKPLSAYFLYSGHRRQELKDAGSELPLKEQMRKFGQEWSSLSEEEKAVCYFLLMVADL